MMDGLLIFDSVKSLLKRKKNRTGGESAIAS